MKIDNSKHKKVMDLYFNFFIIFHRSIEFTEPITIPRPMRTTTPHQNRRFFNSLLIMLKLQILSTNPLIIIDPLTPLGKISRNESWPSWNRRAWPCLNNYMEPRDVQGSSTLGGSGGINFLWRNAEKSCFCFISTKLTLI